MSLASFELKNELCEMEVCLKIIWSTLTAVYHAMSGKENNPENYQDAIYGLSDQVSQLTIRMGTLMENLEEGRNQ